ncbi:hypothetical protein [Promicromonospora sp. NPDC019610]|uniref:hypothetical protein n=1 Tax=Promicromonospora sp. NPDC019610 TaxID=3364405 RepID=UPI0037ABA788
MLRDVAQDLGGGEVVAESEPVETVDRGVDVAPERRDEDRSEREDAHQYRDDRVVGAQLVVAKAHQQRAEGTGQENTVWTEPMIWPELRMPR